MFRLKIRLNAVAMSYISSGEKVRAIVDKLEIKCSGNMNTIIMSAIKAAAISMPLKSYKNTAEYVQHIHSLVAGATELGAQLIAFPELCGMLPIIGTPCFPSIYHDIMHLENNLENTQKAFAVLCESSLAFCGEIYLNTFSKIAQAHGVMIAAGSIFCYENGKIKNRSFLFDEKGKVIGHQDKLFLSQWEIDMGVEAGTEISVIPTKLGSIGLFAAQDAPHFEPFSIGSAMGLDLCIVAGALEDADFATARFRASESNLCIICPTYCGGETFSRQYTHGAAIYAPLTATRTKDGILKKETKGKTALARVDIPKIKSSFDLYMADQNAELYQNNFK